MAKRLLENAAAEKEANDIGFRYMNSSDVLSDMIRDYGGALDGVKVHDDAAADAKVRAVGRDGLASGKDVYMREGSLSSGDPAANGLLAHELTHVMQQDGGMQESVDYGEAQGGLFDWFKRKKKKQELEEAPVPTIDPSQRASMAQAQNDFYLADNAAKDRSFQEAITRYNQSRGDGEKFEMDKGDVRRQRFLHRHMTGTAEENDALFKDVMTRGDAAMMPYFREEAQRMLDFDASKVQNDDWVLQHGGELVAQNKDVHNLFDMISAKRVKAKDLGLSWWQFRKLVGTWDKEKKRYVGGKKGEYANAGGAAMVRLRQIAKEQPAAPQPADPQPAAAPVAPSASAAVPLPAPAPVSASRQRSGTIFDDARSLFIRRMPLGRP